MRCNDIRELMSAHVDGCLDDAGEQQLAAHLAACASCRQDLDDLQRMVNLLQQMGPVAPPPDLTARIHARLRASRRSNILVFLNLPQTRVALAASLVMILTTLGIRQMYATRQLPADAAALRQSPKAVPPATPEPVDSPAVCAEREKTAEKLVSSSSTPPPLAMPEKPAEAAAQEHDKRLDNSLAAKARATTDAKPASLGLHRDEARDGLKDQELSLVKEEAPARTVAVKLNETAAAKKLAQTEENNKRENAAPRSSRTPSDDVHADEVLDAVVANEVAEGSHGYAAKLPADRAPSLPGSAARRTEEGGRQQIGDKAVVSGKTALPDGYTFRTDRLREAAAIVSRHEHKKGGGLKADRDSPDLGNYKAAAAETPQQVVVEVMIPSAEVAGLLEELQQAGAVLVRAPVTSYAPAVAGGPAMRGRLSKTTAAADARIQAPAATLAGAAAAPAAPATNVLVRFVFLLSEP